METCLQRVPSLLADLSKLAELDIAQTWFWTKYSAYLAIRARDFGPNQ